MPHQAPRLRLTPMDIATSSALTRLFVVAVCVTVLGMTGWRVYAARELALETSRVANTNLARSLANHAQAVMNAGDILITDLVERVETDGTSPQALARLEGMMATRVGEGEQIRNLIVFAADGSWRAGTIGGNRPNAADRDYFTYHRDHADRGPHIGPPIVSRTTGRWTVTVSRRIDLPDGAFGGLALAMIDFDTFQKFYASFDLGKRGLISLLDENGTMLVRAPFKLELIGKDFSDAAFFREFRDHGPVGSSEGVSATDGVKRLRSYHRVSKYPLVVFVAQSEEELLAGWRRGAWIALGASGGITALLGLAGSRLSGQIRLRQRAEAAERDREAQYRLLAENSTDMIVRLSPEVRRTYVSPASRVLLGYAPNELLGRDPRELAHPDDKEAVTAYTQSVVNGRLQEPLTYRILHQRGDYIWVELAGKPLQDGGAVLAMRDASRRKEAEIRLHAANNQLQRMVMQDGLTGIANRRCFDAVLQKEVRRAARTELPLTLLLLDVDHFKAYNDTYGHPAGDACLRAIAEAIGGQVQRPGDLTARYGGEEFAVILSETDAAGATLLAERIRQAVRALGIVHAGGRDAIATVSVGVAVAWPGSTDLSADRLIQQADTALYKAKTQGRDCVRMATMHEVVPLAA